MINARQHCTTCRGTRDDHLKSLQDMILTDQKSGNHDDGEESDEGEDVVGLLGEL